MRFPRLSCVFLIVVAVASAGSNASARGWAPGVPSRSISTVIRSAPLGYESPLTLCQLGEHLPGVTNVPILDFDPTGDYYYTWLNLNPDSCATCGGGTYGQIAAAHVLLYFPAAPETLVVSVGIVDYVQTQCRFQNADVHICPAFEETLTCQEPATAIDFTIPFPHECRLEISALGNGQAFLEYNFISSSLMAPAQRPQLVAEGAQFRCHTFEPIIFPQEDWADQYPGTGNPVMYVDVEQCLNVPTIKQTWGQLKMRYRDETPRGGR